LSRGREKQSGGGKIDRVIIMRAAICNMINNWKGETKVGSKSERGGEKERYSNTGGGVKR